MLTEKEIQVVKENFPKLIFVKGSDKSFLRGELTFNAFYDKNQDELVINPDSKSFPVNNFTCLSI